MGLSLHNALAVIEGYIGKKTPFIRTPKFNLTNNKNQSWRANVYLTRSIGLLTVIELALAIYFLAAIYVGFRFEDYGLLPFHLLLVFKLVFTTNSHLIIGITSRFFL